MRRLLRAEHGFSLAEIAIASGLAVGALAVVSSFLVSAQRTVTIEQIRSSSNDDARAAMEQVDREVRSANFILPLDDKTLVVSTQSNKTTLDRCVQWLVQDQQLLRREWPSGSPDDASGWRVVADNVVNQELGEPLFVLPDTPNNRFVTGGQTVDVTIHVNGDLEKSPDSTAVISQSLTGRNVNAQIAAAGVAWPPATPPVECTVPPTGLP